MKRLSILIAISLFYLAACSDSKTTSNPATKINFSNQVGWLHGHCLVIENASLKPQTKVNIISLGETQTQLQSKIKAKLKDESDCIPLLSDRKEVNKTKERHFYLLDLDQKHEEILGFGIINAKQTFTSNQGFINTDLNNNGINENYSSCTGSEGINFLIQEKQKSKKVTLWKSYYYLGYDITPDCPTE